MAIRRLQKIRTKAEAEAEAEAEAGMNNIA